MEKNESKTSAVTPSEDTPMFELEYIQRTKSVLNRIEHELGLDRTTAYRVALYEVMAMDKERQTLDAIAAAFKFLQRHQINCCDCRS